MAHDADMVVIGGGAAGLVAAGMAASLGAKTFLVEEHRLGGDCTWTGCIPSKTLLAAAHLAARMRTADRLGLEPAEPRFDFERIMTRVRETRQHIYEQADAPPKIEAYGVKTIAARARFLDPHTMELTGEGGESSRMTSRYFVIAAGSRARTFDAGVPMLTNENLFEIDELPRRLMVLGAGPIGIEMAQAFHRFGSEVRVVDIADRILPRDDPELSALLQERLAGEGVRFELGQRVDRFEQPAPGTIRAFLAGGTIECDAVLAAIGRVANVAELGLENAGVKFNRRGVIVNEHCRTSQRHIFASGDVAGRFQFTHYAEHMSKVAVSNAILKLPLKLDTKHITWCTYSDPEMAHLGALESELEKRGVSYRVYRLPFAELDRAITESETTGVVKVLARKSGKILGATILGAHAGEMIVEYALAMKNGLKLRHISDTIHPYPTYMLGNRRAADFWYLEKRSPGLVRLLKKLFRYRGE